MRRFPAEQSACHLDFPTDGNCCLAADVDGFDGPCSGAFRLPNTPGTYFFQAQVGTITLASPPRRAAAQPSPEWKFRAVPAQTASPGQAFGQPLQVRVLDASGAPLANQTVTFAVTNGTASVNPPTATTDVNGIARTTATAGQTAGPVLVTASAGGGWRGPPST